MPGQKSKLFFIAACFLIYLLPKEALELPIYDFKTQLRSYDADISSPIVLVDIDDESLAAIGPWPWPRETLSKLINTLATQQGISSSALNILLPSESSLASDENLAKTIQDHEVVMGLAFTNDLNHSSGTLPSPIDFSTHLPTQSYLNSIGLYPGLSKNTEYAGHLNTIVDNDGKLRRIPMMVGSNNNIYPPLALAALQQITLAKQDATSWLSFIQPITNEANIFIPYNFPSSQLNVVSAAKIINREIKAHSYKDHVAIIGSSSLGLGSIISTPLDSRIPSLAIHAYLLDAALSERWITFKQDHLWISKAIIVFTLLMTLFFWQKELFLKAIAFNSFTLIGLFTTNIYDFIQHGEQWPIVDILSVSLFSLIVMLGLLTRSNRNQANAIRSLFSSYVPPSIVKQLVDGDIKTLQKGEFRQVTVLFADIVNFSKLIDTHSANDLTKTMHLIFDCLTNVVLNNNGTVDKYMGDSIMAFWGAPIEDKEQAEHAVVAAKQMQESLKKLNMDISVGIGISTGYVIVGNLGSTFRHSYSVMGEAVNIAARLERKTRELNTPILISQSTANKLTITKATPHTTLKLKGIDKCINTFTV